MCTCLEKERPADILSHVCAKLAFIGDVFAQNDDTPTQLSTRGEFGLFLLLRGLEDEVKAISDQLFEAEKEVNP